MVFSFDFFYFFLLTLESQYANIMQRKKDSWYRHLRVDFFLFVCLFLYIFKALNVPRDRLLFFLLVVALSQHSGYCTAYKGIKDAWKPKQVFHS